MRCWWVVTDSRLEVAQAEWDVSVVVAWRVEVVWWVEVMVQVRVMV